MNHFSGLAWVRTHLSAGIFGSSLSKNRNGLHHRVPGRIWSERPSLQLRHLQRNGPVLQRSGISEEIRTSSVRCNDRGRSEGHLGHARLVIHPSKAYIFFIFLTFLCVCLLTLTMPSCRILFCLGVYLCVLVKWQI